MNKRCACLAADGTNDWIETDNWLLSYNQWDLLIDMLHAQDSEGYIDPITKFQAQCDDRFLPAFNQLFPGLI